jgi:hypothetical protein
MKKMAVTVRDVVESNDADEPIIIKDNEKYIYDGRLGDVPESLYERVVKSTGWLMVAQKHLIKVEAEPDGEFSTRLVDPGREDPITVVSFCVKRSCWERLGQSSEWKAFLKLLGEAQKEKEGSV